MFKGAWHGGIDQQKVRSCEKEGGVYGHFQAFRGCLAYYNTMVDEQLITDSEYDEFIAIAEEIEKEGGEGWLSP